MNSRVRGILFSSLRSLFKSSRLVLKWTRNYCHFREINSGVVSALFSSTWRCARKEEMLVSVCWVS